MVSKNIYQGDSIDLFKGLKDNSVDLVITSPPYSSLKNYISNNGIPPDEYVDWFLPYCKEIERVLKNTGSFILNINDKVESRFRHPYVYDLISSIHKETELKMFERLFWNKKKSLPNKSRFGDRVEYLFWFAKSDKFKFFIDEMRTEYSESSIKRMKKPLKKRFAREPGDENKGYKNWSPNEKGALPTTLVSISSETKRIAEKHVAVYPVELVEYFIKGSTDIGDLVLDPFIGVGTTAVACDNLSRNWIGFELEQEYIDIANKRISDNLIEMKK
jgi:site-specific DNA-methyltransferase (adenine-specific)/site-specific DNA-methyltransferase (cytosine-N4-specific)